MELGWRANSMPGLMLNPMNADDEPTDVILLVHGTFARKAEWTRPGSAIFERLRKEFGKKFKIDHWDWSGRNSHWDRSDAGVELARFIEEQKRGHLKRYVLVTHSHGGNVVRNALKSPAVREKVDAVIALGTPFIQCAPRVPREVFEVVVWCLRYASALVLILLGIAGLQFVPEHLATATFAVAVAAAILVSRMDWDSLVRWVSAAALDRQAETRRRIQPAYECEIPFLHVVADGDEAYAYLSRLHSMSEIPFRLWVTVGAVGLPLALTGFAAAMLPPLLSVLGVDLNYNPHFHPEGKVLFYIVLTIGAAGIALWLLLIFLMFMLPFAMTILPRFVRAGAHGYGGESVLDNALTRISVVEKPAEFSNVHVVRMNPDDCPTQTRKGVFKRVVASLRHCRLYSSGVALDEIVSWLQLALARRQRQ